MGWMIVVGLLGCGLLHAEVERTGLVLDLDADRGVQVDEQGRVVRWTNQVDHEALDHFVPQDEGRKVPGSGRPHWGKENPLIKGHRSVHFKRQELINHSEDALDHVITGAGHTWFLVVRVDAQVVQLKDVNSIFGNLKNGGFYEGIWANVTDDNRVWIGGRNGKSFGRWDANNPLIQAKDPLATDRFYVVAGRMGSGKGTVQNDLFIDSATPVVSKPFPVNPKANASKLAIGQERDAINHPGRESFDGEIARLLIYDRPLTDADLSVVMRSLQTEYGLAGSAGTFAPPFYAFFNGMPKMSVEEEAVLLKELGYSGISQVYGVGEPLNQRAAVYEKHGLKVLSNYVGATENPIAAEQVKALANGGMIELTVRKMSPEIVASIRQTAEMAAQQNTRVALYPHHGFTVATMPQAMDLVQKVNHPNLGIVFNLCHFLKNEQAADLERILKDAAPHLFAVTTCGADVDGENWGSLIQTLDKGTFSQKRLFAVLKEIGFQGPVGLQGYGIKGDKRTNLESSMKAWKAVLEDL